MRVSKIFLYILIILTLSLLFVACENGIGDVSDTYPDTPSEAVTTEEVTVSEETSGFAETEEVTTEEETTEEITTEEITTEEVTTEEVTVPESTEDETTAAPEPHEHVWSSWTLSKPAGCVDNGEEKRTCLCGESEIRYTDVLGHTEGRFITVEKATCTSDGYGHRICGRCTLILTTESVPATGHTEVVTGKKATCTEDGFEKTSCKVCGSELSSRVIKALGHTEGRHIVVNKASCTEDGIKDVVCAVCTLVLRTEITKATGHTEGKSITVSKLTCTEDGVADIICASCTMVLRTETTKAQGHKEGKTIVAKKATCTEEGLHHVICSVCTLILREETVDATGHTVGPWVTSAELSTDEISVRQKHCVLCDLLMEEEKVKSLTLVEAERVAGLINAVGGKNSFTFAALSDMHVDNVFTGYNQIPTKKSCEFAAKTVSILERLVDIEAAVMLGDYTASSRGYSAEHVLKDFEYVRECFSRFGDYPVAWIRGNHEINYYKDSDRPMTNDEIYDYIESNSRGMIVDPQNPTGGYGYTDFPENKIRMIYLNTSDVYTEYTFTEGEDAPSVGISSVQLAWLAETALDFSDKPDALEWGIILNSHTPLNYTADISRVLLILEAYRDGGYGSISYINSNRYYRIEYDFYGIERAEIICSIHGHSHNFRSEMISSSKNVDPWLWRLCIPNICAGRENDAADAGNSFAMKWGDFDENGKPIYYTKCHWDDELGTFVYDEEDATSFCMVTVDRAARKIYAHYVGTGRDRAFEY